MQLISDCQLLCAQKDPYNHDMADLRDMSTTAEIRVVIQMWFFDMLPQICSGLKSDPITSEIHPYLRNCFSNILELYELCLKNAIYKFTFTN